MKFLDQVKIFIKAGDGGSGSPSFRREKFIEFGGPDGGDGGKGGSIIIKSERNLNTLIDYRYQQHFKAKRGGDGRGKNQTGKGGEDLFLKVPLGTQLFEEDNKTLIFDFNKRGEKFIAAAGGKGGLGNTRFKSSTNRAPRKFTKGATGEEFIIWLQLKTIADIGIIGLPNAGKSTLISVLSSAKPKIADYPFTTLIPNLGVVRRPSGDGTVFADIPGLISGASKGIGLGHDFLRHIERTRVLLHLIDSASNDPINDFKTINEELRSYGHDLISKPRIFVLNKKELLDENDIKKLLNKIEQLTGKNVHVISAVTRFGLENLLSSIWNELGY